MRSRKQRFVFDANSNADSHPYADATPTPNLVALANQPPVPVYLALLMTDGSVLVQASPNSAAGISAADYYLLTPELERRLFEGDVAESRFASGGIFALGDE